MRAEKMAAVTERREAGMRGVQGEWRGGGRNAVQRGMVTGMRGVSFPGQRGGGDGGGQEMQRGGWPQMGDEGLPASDMARRGCEREHLHPNLPCLAQQHHPIDPSHHIRVVATATPMMTSCVS